MRSHTEFGVNNEECILNDIPIGGFARVRLCLTEELSRQSEAKLGHIAGGRAPFMEASADICFSASELPHRGLRSKGTELQIRRNIQ